MDFSELKNRTVAELKKIVAESREELRELRFKARNQQLKQNHRLAQIRQTIARAMMLIKDKSANK